VERWDDEPKGLVPLEIASLAAMSAVAAALVLVTLAQVQIG
jgi:hypothetical protein